MAKRRYGIDEEKIERFIKEGRGTGEGQSYKPWLTIQDVPSKGLASRVFGRKSGREHHLLSKVEKSYFHLLDWSDDVLDIREQYPLNREATREIAIQMNVVHPREVGSKTDIVMTTDFLVTCNRGGQIVYVARSVKTLSDLENPRTLEKQEIERRYWFDKGIEWGFLLDEDVPKARVQNLIWLHEFKSLEHLVEKEPGRMLRLKQKYLENLHQNSELNIIKFHRFLNESQGFGAGEPMTILRHLLSSKEITIDLSEKFSDEWPMTKLELQQVHTSQVKVG